MQGHDEIVWAVEVSGARLFSASADKTIRVWDIESRRCEQARLGSRDNRTEKHIADDSMVGSGVPRAPWPDVWTGTFKLRRCNICARMIDACIS